MTRRCPGCRARTITPRMRIGARFRAPIRCPACGASLEVRTGPAVIAIYTFATAALFGAVAAVLALGAFWPLVLFLVVLVAADVGASLVSPVRLRAAAS